MSGWQRCSLKLVFIREKKPLNYLPAVVDDGCYGFSFYMYTCHFNILGAEDLSGIVRSCHVIALNGQVFFVNTCRIYSGFDKILGKEQSVCNLHSIHKNNMYNRKVSDVFSLIFFKQ